ncbi:MULTISPECIES: vitamin K epoxide reductase family protein [unclassified Microbacterium]|uniref:vitamin K epoxide reductase family protein n=1 Tax=unclassified Microbacterium TaxID=2609290 RepID=UPI0038689726
MRASAAQGWLFVISGVLGAAASAILLIERIRLLEEPGSTLACDINPFVACAPVMTSPAASIFGFPNPIFGLVCFTVIVTTGVVLISGIGLPRWYWGALAVGAVLAGILISWLQYQSMTVIGALCIWCMLVWAATIPLVVTIVGVALARADVLGRRGATVGRGLLRYRPSIIAVWYLAVLAALVVTFLDDLLAAL